jgi:hypothetical protein
MESTSIEAEQTAGEIMALLRGAGARQISMDYAADGRITGMRFIIVIHDIPHPFCLPVRTDAIRKLFKDRRVKTTAFNSYKYAEADAAQAERVAWRQLLMWIKSQLSMVDAGMVQVREVFSPYLLDPSGRTLFEYLEETRYKALPPGKKA